MDATRTVPIIAVMGDPVGAGLITSLARPGGNLTGVAIMSTELSGKRLELLTQALPTARLIAVLANPGAANPGAANPGAYGTKTNRARIRWSLPLLPL
jgi:putative ABC transport system substrate-binding protein